MRRPFSRLLSESANMLFPKISGSAAILGGLMIIIVLRWAGTFDLTSIQKRLITRFREQRLAWGFFCTPRLDFASRRRRAWIR
jgi:hypothetical protein